MPSTGAVVKPLPSRTWGVSLGAFLHLATAHRLHSGTLQSNVNGKVHKNCLIALKGLEVIKNN
ncbi:hypothetical protein DDW09_03380 [Sulfolobus sp. SCGC AB-777_L09]|nr:hypothetical protein DDW09_03380 [Sulfolobus sp. SCGC AB-777_L09]